MIEHKFEITKTCRYHQLGNNSHCDEIWIVCHGYRQLSRYFIKNFIEFSDLTNVCVIAPEGLHRFYIEGYSGNVGSSWMTKEAREDDIKDYVNYLDLLIKYVLESNTNNPRINVLGFSQGSATAARWCALGKVKQQNLILWSGAFPPDLDFASCLNDIGKCMMVIGEDDEFISKKMALEHQSFLDVNQVQYSYHLFKGGHEIPHDTLMTVWKELSVE